MGRRRDAVLVKTYSWCDNPEAGGISQSGVFPGGGRGLCPIPSLQMVGSALGRWASRMSGLENQWGLYPGMQMAIGSWDSSLKGCHKERKLYASISDEHRWKTLQPEISDEICEYIKRLIQYDQMEFIPGVQGWFTICKSISVIHTLMKWRIKILSISQWMQKKTFDRIQHSFMIKS